MPTYEYECNECKCRFDKRQRFSDEPIAICPKCNSISKRVMVPAPVIFKGSGFYITDYRSKDTNKSAPPPPSPSSSPAASSKPTSSPSPSPSPS
jgi:putative FmdB family regulatory protein